MFLDLCWEIRIIKKETFILERKLYLNLSTYLIRYYLENLKGLLLSHCQICIPNYYTIILYT
jgi:hypothetical protein